MTIVLMRHATYRVDENFDEHLTEKGKSQADSIGDQLVERGIVPDRIWLSYRKQAVQTAGRLVAVFNRAGEGREILLETKDWLADEKKLCEKPPEGETVLIVAHEGSFKPLALAFGAGWGQVPKADHGVAMIFEGDKNPRKVACHISPQP